MVVVAHQAVRRYYPVKSFCDETYDGKKVGTVLVSEKYRLPGIPAGGYVIHRARIFYAQGSSHTNNVVRLLLYCKT